MTSARPPLWLAMAFISSDEGYAAFAAWHVDADAIQRRHLYAQHCVPSTRYSASFRRSGPVIRSQWRSRAECQGDLQRHQARQTRSSSHPSKAPAPPPTARARRQAVELARVGQHRASPHARTSATMSATARSTPLVQRACVDPIESARRASSARGIENFHGEWTVDSTVSALYACFHRFLAQGSTIGISASRLVLSAA